ncbi:MAG TPA: hypothetical protein PL182_09535, partial [Pseudobdellovibrionaceae bacterium]|nr:hypothetical protein [Pseudobdellovibrionaceae bacterium]
TIATTTPISEIVMQVDTFGNKTFSATDKDYFANNFPNSTRQTYLSFCATPDVYNCEADRSGWPAVVGSYDPAYTANAGVATGVSAACAASR